MVRAHLNDLPGDHPTRNPAYRPSDPEWSDRDVLLRLREQLHAIDPKLEVWWVPNRMPDDPEQKGRWAIVYYMTKARVWSVVDYWVTPGGGYRKIEVGAVQPFLNFVHSMDEAANEADKRSASVVEAEKKKNHDELQSACAEVAGDMFQRSEGVRQTFGHHGAIRSRPFSRGQLSRERANAHAQWLQRRR